MPHVLVTGSAGAVGGAVVRECLARGYGVRGLDLRPTPELPDALVGPITNVGLLQQAVAGMDTVIHLAATVDDADFLTQLLPNNIVAVYQLFEAAKAAGVRRVVMASTIQTVGRAWRDLAPGQVLPPDAAAPTNGYAVTKLFAEDLGRLYALRHGLSVIMARIGFLPRTPEVAQAFLRRPRLQGVYLSHRDAGRFFACCVEAAQVEFAVLWATGKRNEPGGCDLGPSREVIGYEPQDAFPDGLPWPVPPL